LYAEFLHFQVYASSSRRREGRPRAGVTETFFTTVTNNILNDEQALCPEAVICDPRVVNRVQTHLSEGTAGFHLNIFDSSGNLFPRKLAITPLQITVLSPPTAGQPGSNV
jgi:hypothetical protein